jgi:tRNA-splicing ligase RtcB (3'-phosphate/5'-hydroxy nucleic acid ligase)
VPEHTGDYEWRLEGEETEAVLYAPDESALDYPGLRTGLAAATRLPGVEGPVYAAASSQGSGWAAASASHVAPGLVSAPRVGLLLVAASPLNGLRVPPEEVPRLLTRRLSEVSMPSPGESALDAACESGARWAAGKGLVEEQDLEHLHPVYRGEPDALGRRALAAGAREWDPRPEGDVRAFGLGEALDSEAVERLGLYERALVLEVSVGSGELGRLALEGHRQRTISRDFGDAERLVAVPSGIEESDDFVAAVEASAGYAAARASLLVYALRRALEEVTGRLELAAGWRVGGVQERSGAVVHRRSLAHLQAGDVLVCGGALALGTGAMLGGAPPFEPDEVGDEWVWEEAGLLERIARLRRPEDYHGG